MQYTSNANYTSALLSSIKTTFIAPINISSDQIQNLVVTTGISLPAMRTELPTSTSSDESIDVSYQIFTNSKYPSTAYSTQLINFVNSGSFNTKLHYYAMCFSAPGFLDAKSTSISTGKYILKVD
jgi:hypothetical protein